MTMKKTPRNEPIQNSGLRFSCPQASLHRLFCLTSWLSAAGAPTPIRTSVSTWAGSRLRCSCSVITDPRVEDGVEHVDDQVEEDEEEHHQRHDADDDGTLLRPDGVEDLASDAGEVEHRLRDDGTAQQGPDVGPDER